MNKNYYLILLSVFLFISCQMKTNTVSIDPVTVKAEVTKTLDNIDAAYKSKDSTTILSYYTDDALICGTDPTEIWNKEAYKKVMTQMLADTTMSTDMKIDKMEILVDKSGNSANVLRQFVTSWSKPVSVRETLHFMKIDNKWMIDFSSFGLIPENMDLPKIAAVASNK